MTRGKTIQIYLPDGNPSGIKECHITTGVLRAVSIPRNELKKAKEINILTQPGIYFLFSKKDDETSQFRSYIGEAEDTLHRVNQHDNDKEGEEYWNYAVCFVSATNNMNKAHVKFLEAHCIKNARENERTKLQNSTMPKGSSLTKQETDFSLDLFDEINILLGTLGYPVFEPIKKVKDDEDIFYCKNKDANAKGNLTEEGFVVYSGSIANSEERPSAGKPIIAIRRKLIDDGVLIKEGNVLKFTKDFVFGSPSTAAAIVVGGNANGWRKWKNKDGKTLDEIKRQEEV